MSLLNAMEALAREWDDVLRRLGSEQATRTHDLGARFVNEPDLNVSASIAEDIVDLLLEVLPAEHPVLIALQRPQDMPGAAADQAWRQVAVTLRARLRGRTTYQDATPGEQDDAHTEHGGADDGHTSHAESSPGGTDHDGGYGSEADTSPATAYEDGWPSATRGGPPGTTFGDDDDDEGMM